MPSKRVKKPKKKQMYIQILEEFTVVSKSKETKGKANVHSKQSKNNVNRNTVWCECKDQVK